MLIYNDLTRTHLVICQIIFSKKKKEINRRNMDRGKSTQFNNVKKKKRERNRTVCHKYICCSMKQTGLN